MAPQFVGGYVNLVDPTSFIATMKKLSIQEIETSPRYRNGESEKSIGKHRLGEHFAIDTKILWPDNSTQGHMAPGQIDQSLSNSLQVLGVDKINILYSHSADFETPIAIQARAFDEHYRMGRFIALGLSSHPPSMVREWVEVADKEGLVKPTYYQCQYNLLCRGLETKYLPLFREHGINLVALSPLAGGFLLGKVTRTERTGSRFSGDTSSYADWYDRPVLHDALDRLKGIAATSRIPIEVLSLRWLAHHSALTSSDKIVVGGGDPKNYEQMIAVIKQGPLTEELAEELGSLYEICRGEADEIDSCTEPAEKTS